MVESLRTTTGHVTCRVGGVVADDVSCMHTGTFYTHSILNFEESYLPTATK